MDNSAYAILESVLKSDPGLKKFENIIRNRIIKIQKKEEELTKDYRNLAEFASGYKYFGLHKCSDSFVFREWAPNAEKIYITGDFN
jgi:1,4-alpha-glucan branching enzyme